MVAIKVKNKIGEWKIVYWFFKVNWKSYLSAQCKFGSIYSDWLRSLHEINLCEHEETIYAQLKTLADKFSVTRKSLTYNLACNKVIPNSVAFWACKTAVLWNIIIDRRISLCVNHLNPDTLYFTWTIRQSKKKIIPCSSCKIGLYEELCKNYA